MAFKPCLDCSRLANGSRCRICASIREQANPYQDANRRRLSRAVTGRDGACVQFGSTHYLSAHHVQPRAEGGPDAPGNLASLCASCHARLEAQRRAAQAG